MKPQVRNHLIAALSSLTAAFAAMLETPDAPAAELEPLTGSGTNKPRRGRPPGNTAPTEPPASGNTVTEPAQTPAEQPAKEPVKAPTGGTIDEDTVKALQALIQPLIKAAKGLKVKEIVKAHGADRIADLPVSAVESFKKAVESEVALLPATNETY